MIELFGGHVEESPSPGTQAGSRYYAENPDHPGSLGIAISEAVEMAARDEAVKYSLGSVLDSVMMHQSIIGQEADSQVRELGLSPDVVIGCVGGGSNFAGLAFPFVRKNLTEGGNTRFVAVEPESCPTLTGGDLRYDHGDSVGMTPLLYMHSLGMEFVPPPIHAGGLRYHGMAPLVSHLVKSGMVEPVAYGQDPVFSAARTFLMSEGILPAPESAHAIAAVIDEAVQARENNEEKVIFFNLSGHGFLDINAFDQA